MGTCRTTTSHTSEQRRRGRRRTALWGAATFALATGLAVPAGAASAATDDPVRVAAGLDNPRHLTLATDGTLFVAEAGHGGAGPCVTGPEGDEVCFGRSGAVTRVTRQGVQGRVLTGLPSLAAPNGEGATGPQGVDLGTGDRLDVAIGLGGTPDTRATMPTAGARLGTLERHRLATGSRSTVADIAVREATSNPVDDVDSNPVAVLRRGTSTLVTDAGANAVFRIAPDGSMSTAAAFPTDREAPAPPFLGLPPGTMLPVQSVPTSTAVGPDGALYVSELTGFPFEAGLARIYRVAPGGAVSVYADGLTNVTDLAFDGGTLYAVQIADEGILAGPSGSLVRVVPGGAAVTVVDDLFAPYGLAIRKGHAYLSTGSVLPGGGEVWRYALAD